MKTVPALSTLLALLLVAAPAWASRPAPAASMAVAAPSVTVTYDDPQQFTENRYRASRRHDRDDYLDTLKAYLIRRAAPMLNAGQRLEVTVTDIKLAGNYEPWRGPQWDDVRFMRDVYPPRIDLRFRLVDAHGKVLRQGARTLRNLGYLHDTPARPGDTDPLRYDKALIDKWLHGGPDAW